MPPLPGDSLTRVQAAAERGSLGRLDDAGEGNFLPNASGAPGRPGVK
jgi:hypothetical protein